MTTDVSVFLCVKEWEEAVNKPQLIYCLFKSALKHCSFVLASAFWGKCFCLDYEKCHGGHGESREASAEEKRRRREEEEEEKRCVVHTDGCFKLERGGGVSSCS